MRPIGAKSITTVVITLLMLGLALYGHRLDSERLLRLWPAVGFCVGLFTILGGTWLFRLAGWGSPSTNYFRFARSGFVWDGEWALFRWGTRGLYLGRPTHERHERPRELPRALMIALSYGSCFLIALVCFNNRTIDLMLNSPKRLSSVGVRFCPEEKPPVEKPVEIKPGCELVMRGFKLGYVKNLGSCAPEEKEEKLELCTLRQIDEPYLHYSARRFFAFLDLTQRNLGGDGWRDKFQRTLSAQLTHLRSLSGKLGHVVQSAPKSSHHIFTNLPYPGGKMAELWHSWFEPNDCLSRYRKLAHAVQVSGKDAEADSRILDHIYGQMLFNPRYDQAAGHCKEYVIHWSAPVDSCERLARSPEAFLKSEGAAEPVQAVLKRFEERRDIEALSSRLSSVNPAFQSLRAPNTGSKLKPKVEASPQSLLSFQCLMKTPQATGGRTRLLNFSAFGQEFQARDVRVATSTDAHRIQVDMYRSFSQAMDDGFSYIGYFSREGPEIATQWHVVPELFDTREFPLLSLEYLKGADLFRGNEWLQKRDDLLEVYPYYHHLYHFVELFRQHYRTRRTRL